MNKLIVSSRRLLRAVYYDSKLKYKLAVSYMVIILFSALIIGFPSYDISHKFMIQSEKDSLKQSMEQLNNTIDYFFETYLNKSEMLYTNVELQNYLAKQNEDIEDFVETNRKINAVIDQMVNEVHYSYLKNSYNFGGNLRAKIYVMNPTIHLDGYNIFYYSDIMDEEWYQELIESDKYVSWQSGFLDKNNNYNVVINRRLIDFKTHQDIGILRLFIPAERIYNLITNNINSHICNILFVDDKFNIIASTGSLFQNNDNLFDKRQFSNKTQAITEVDFDGKWYIEGNINSEITGWNLIYLMPVSIITGRVRSITKIVILTTIISLIICIFVSSLVSSFVTGRIDILVEKANAISQGNLTISTKLSGNDEIGQLDKTFNNMIMSINNLIENNYKAKVVVNQTKLELLQEQINPHLLYNTLSVISMIAKNSNSTDIFNVTDNLINFYKGILNMGIIYSSLGSEIDMVKRYVDIMKYVYRLDMEVIYDFDKEINDYYSIKLFLQPIVENAIVHGIKPAKIGTINIIGEKEQECIKFVISDDGIGMDKETLDAITDMDKNIRKGYGLSNVIRRIKLFFGDGYGVSIESQKGIGTVVEVKIPIFTKKEVEEYLNKEFSI